MLLTIVRRLLKVRQPLHSDDREETEQSEIKQFPRFDTGQVQFGSPCSSNTSFMGLQKSLSNKTFLPWWSFM